MNCLKQIAVGLALVCAMGPACAQLGNGGATYSGMMNSADQAGDLMRKFVTVTHNTMSAEATMLAVVGQAGDADKAIAQTRNLGPDMNVELTEGVLAVQTQTGGALQRGLSDKKLAFDEAGKRQFSDSMQTLAKSVLEYASLTKELPSVKQALKMAGNKARVAYYAAKTIPGSLAEMRQTLKAAAAFAGANAIPLGADVEQALAVQ